MRFKYLVLAAALAPAAAFAQTSYNTINYSQNFDTLASTGTTGTVLPTGFTFLETGGNANTSYTVGTGSGTAGDTYSFGLAGSTDRAFGSIGSGSLGPVYYGFQFTNGLNSAITGFDINYFGEQWRLGNSTDDGLVFEYSLNATAFDNGTWTSVSSLDFDPLFTSGTQGALNGNLAANRRALSGTISGLNILAGQRFTFRWTDQNSGGTDHGLAIDDVSISARVAAGAVPEPATWAMMMLGFGAMGTVLRKRTRTAARVRFA